MSHTSRLFTVLPLLLVGSWAAVVTADSEGVAALSSKDAAGGLRAALAQGIDKAVTQLGAHNGFLNDSKVAIPLPKPLDEADQALRVVGMGEEGDKLRATMNHAAEQAVVGAGPVFKRALQRMTLADAKSILTGGDDAGTQYFRRATNAELTAQFKPIVARETAKLQVAALYDKYAGKAADLGIIKAHDAHLNDYITDKALDGLFSRIADEERAIRKDPLGQANSLIRSVFGSLVH